MAETLTGLDSSMKYAIAARDLGRAQEFARRWGFSKADGWNLHTCLIRRLWIL